jgi:hypothetical protein
MKHSLLLILLLSSANAYPALYKWVDSNNQTHYSEEPPVNRKAQLLSSRSAVSDTAAASAPAARKTLMERAAELNKAKLAKQAVAAEAAKKQAYNAALKANCDAAQKNLAALRDGIRLVEMDANGERSFMSDEQRGQRMAKAQQDIQENCK